MKKASGFKPTKATLITILLSSMLMLMGGAAVAPALPLIEQVFPGEDTLVSMIITIPSLAVAVVGFGMGALADRFGKVRILVTSLVIFAIAGVAGFFIEGGSDSQLYLLLAFRFVVGIGIAGISSSVIALIAEYYSGMERAKVLGYQAAAMGVGVLVLEYTGGSLAGISWREPFLVYLIGIPIMLLAIMSMREPVREPRHDEDVGVPDRKANGALLAVCYVAIFMAMLISFLLPTKLPTFLQMELDVSTSVTGLFLGLYGVINAGISLMYRRIVLRVRPFVLIAVGFLLMGLSLMLLDLSPTIAAAVLMMVMAGLGIGLITPAVSNLLATETTATNSGKIMGVYSTCLNLGQFAISLISVPLFALVGSSYPSMFAVMGVVAVVVCVVFLVLSRTGIAGRGGSA